MITIHWKSKDGYEQGWKTFDDFTLATLFRFEKIKLGFKTWKSYPE